MKNIQVTLFFLCGITVVYFSFYIFYYAKGFDYKLKWCRLKYNIIHSTATGNVNGVVCFDVAKQYLLEKIPMSLWHNPNREQVHSNRNDRIRQQRKLMEYLSHIEGQIPVKKILIVLGDGPSDWLTPPHKEPLCPYNYTIIRNKCNFFRQNVTEIETKSLKLQDYDVVVYHTKRTAETIDKVWNPRTKQPAPLFIYFNEESSLVQSVNLAEHDKIIATYWSNADISVPYGKWINDTRRSQFTKFLPSTSEGRNFAEGKSKLAAWFVSNCWAKNRRLEIIVGLRQYNIQVDIYGHCSPEKKNCEPNCFEMLKRDYKFYFAFENANCKDYITEKLYRNAFQNDVVPIVMGAHPDDYAANAPPHSYIHIEDFDSPKSLAEYLLLLDQNDDLYNEYFHWRGKGQFIKAHNDFFCRACAMTMYADFFPKPKWRRHSTLRSENHCLAKDEVYWNRI